jgi:protocatechuate 3,4-dioxygenase beta subunit
MEQQHSRKQFLRNMIVGATSIPLILQACSKEAAVKDTTAVGNTGLATSKINADGCIVTPTEIEGPFPLYNSRGSSIVRTNITDGIPGLPLSINFTVGNVNNHCAVFPNARVDIWQCDKDGYYSGYVNDGYLGQQDNTGRLFGRGIQYTDNAGLAHFDSIYPGWYPGRIAHLHVQIFLKNRLRLTTQIAFPDEINYAVYQTPLYDAHGQNTTVPDNISDPVFYHSLDYELATVAEDPATGGYTLSHTIYIAA